MTRFLLLLCALLCAPLLFGQDARLEGKRMVVFGDSYVRNHLKPVEETWHCKFARKHGMHYLNCGMNGNCIAMDRKRFGEAMYKRYAVLPDSVDLLVVIAGHNDARLLDSIGIDTFRLRLGQLCDSLIRRHPTATILFFTPWGVGKLEQNGFREVVNAIIEVCGSRAIPVFDAARNSNIYVSDDGFRRLYFQNRGVGDEAHLNDAGHDRFLPVAEKFILSHLPF